MAEDKEKLGEGVVEVTADNSKLKTALDGSKAIVTKQLDDLGKQAGGFITKIAAGFTIGALVEKGISGLVRFGAAAVENAGNLVDMSAKTGTSIEWLQRAGFVAKQTGSDVGELNDAVFKLGINIAKGGKEVSGGLDKIGLSLNDIKKLKPEEQFDAIAAALKGIENPQERNRVALEIFGKSASKILPAVLDDYTRLKNEAPVVADAQIQALDRAADRWDKFKDQVSAATATMLGNMVMETEQAANGWGLFFGDVAATLKGGIGGHREYIKNLQDQRDAEASAAEALRLKAEAAKNAVPVVVTYSEKLASARKEVQDLSAEERKNFKAAVELGASMDDLTASFGISEGAVTLYKDQLTKSAEASKKSKAETEKLAEANKTLLALQAGVTDEVRDQIIALDAQGLSTEQIATKLKTYGAVVSHVIELEKERIKTAEEAWAQTLEDHKREQEQADKEMDKFFANLSIKDDAEKAAANEHQKRVLSTYDYDRYLIDQWAADEKKKVDKSVAGWEDAFTAIESAAEEKFASIAATESEAVMKMAVDAEKLKHHWQDIVTGIPALLQQALTGGGGFSGFGKALSSQIGTEIGNGLVGTSTGTKIFGSIADKMGSMFGKGIGNAFAMAVPGIGALVGPLLTKGLTALTSLVTNAFGNKTKDARDAFAKQLGFGDLGSLYDDLKNLGPEGESLAHIGGSIIGRNDEEGNRKWMDDVKKFYDDVKQKKIDTAEAADKALLEEKGAYEALQAAVEKYGFTIEELGPKWKEQELNKMAGDLLKDYAMLTASGIDQASVISHMGSAFQDYANTAKAAGVEIPLEMRKVLQSLVDQGKLLDDNGEKITDLDKAGYKFSMTMSQGFQNVIDRLDKLIGKITGELVTGLETLPSPQIEVGVSYRYDDFNLPPVTPNIDSEGFYFDTPQMDKGGFANWGPNGTLVTVHNTEAIMPLDRLKEFAASGPSLTAEDLVQAMLSAGLDRPNITIAPHLEGALASDMYNFAQMFVPWMTRVLQDNRAAASQMAGALGSTAQ